MKAVTLDFRFKGARTYVHGTDMVNAVVAALAGDCPAGLDDLDISFRRVTDRNLLLECVAEEDDMPAASGDVATLSFRCRGNAWRGRLVAREDAAAGRYPYDEDAIVAACTFADGDGPSVTLDGAAPFSPVETLVAMTKALHRRVMPDGPAQWLFARLVAAHWPPARPLAGVRVTLRQRLGTRLTRCDAMQDGVLLAQVYFSAGDRT